MAELEQTLGTIIQCHEDGGRELSLDDPSYVPVKGIYISNGSQESIETAKSLMAAGIKLSVLPKQYVGNLMGRKQLDRLRSSDVLFLDQSCEDRLSYLPEGKVVLIVDEIDSSHDEYVQLNRNKLPLSNKQKEDREYQRCISSGFRSSDNFSGGLDDLFGRLEERKEEQKMGTDVMDATTFKTIYEERQFGRRRNRDLFSFSFLGEDKESLLDPVFGSYLRKRPLALLEEMLRAPSTDIRVINDGLDLIDSFVSLGADKARDLSKKMNAIADLSEAIKALTQSTSFMLQCYHGRLGADMSSVYKERGMNWDLPCHFDPKESIAISIREESYQRFMKAAETVLKQSEAITVHVDLPDFDSVTLRRYKLGMEYALNPDNANGMTALLTKLKELTKDNPENSDQLLKRMGYRDKINRYAISSSFLMEAANHLAMYAGSASFFIDNNWTRPEVLEPSEQRIGIKNGWNPLLQKEEKVPNDTYLNGNTQVEIIEGANKAGKTVYLLQVPLIMNFAQSGFYVPAEKAVLSAHERIFVRLKKSGNLRDNQSAYGAELDDTEEMFRKISGYECHSLVCLDEWFTSTRFDDGEALLSGIIEGEFIPKGVRAIVSTHFPHLANLRSIDGVVTSYFPIENVGGNLIYSYKKTESTSDTERPHYGLAVAESTNLPRKVIDIAKSRLRKQS